MHAHRSRRLVVGEPLVLHADTPAVSVESSVKAPATRRSLRQLRQSHDPCLTADQPASHQAQSAASAPDGSGRRRLHLAAGLIDLVRDDGLGQRFTEHQNRMDLDDRDGVPLLNEAWRSARHLVIASLDDAVRSGLTTHGLLGNSSNGAVHGGLSDLPLAQIRDVCLAATDHQALLDGIAKACRASARADGQARVNPYDGASALLGMVRGVSDALRVTESATAVPLPDAQGVLDASVALMMDPLGARLPAFEEHLGIDATIRDISLVRSSRLTNSHVGFFLRPWARHRVRTLVASLIHQADVHQRQRQQVLALTESQADAGVRAGVRASHRAGTMFSGTAMTCIERMTDLLETGIKRRPEYDVGNSQDSDHRLLINVRFGAVATAMDEVSQHSHRIGKEESLAYRRIVTKAISAIPIGDHQCTARLLDIARTSLSRMIVAGTAQGKDPMTAARHAAGRLRGVSDETTLHLAGTKHPERTVTGVFVRFIALDDHQGISGAFSRAPQEPRVFNRRLDAEADARIWVAPLEEIFHLDHDPRLLAENLGFGAALISHGAVAIIDIRNPHTVATQSQDVTELVHASRSSVAALASGNTDMARIARSLNYDREGFNLLCQKGISEDNDRAYARFLGEHGGSPWAPGILDAAKQSDPLLFARLAIHRSIGANEFFRGGVTQDQSRGLVGCQEFLLTRANRLGSEVGIMECIPIITPTSVSVAQQMVALARAPNAS